MIREQLSILNAASLLYIFLVFSSKTDDTIVYYAAAAKPSTKSIPLAASTETITPSATIDGERTAGEKHEYNHKHESLLFRENDPNPTTSASPGNSSSYSNSDTDFDCAARLYAYEFSVQKLPWSSRSERRHIRDALRLQECPVAAPFSVKEREEEPLVVAAATSTATTEKEIEIAQVRVRRGRRGLTKQIERKPMETKIETAKTTAEFEETFKEKVKRLQQETSTNNNNNSGKHVFLFVDPEHGDDDDGASGNIVRPFRTIDAALAMTRRNRNDGDDDFDRTLSSFTIVLRGGRYYLEETIDLDSQDQNLTILAYPNETPLLSGGDPLSLTMRPTLENPNIYSAKLPPRRDERKTYTNHDGNGNTNSNVDGNVDGNDNGGARQSLPLYNFTTLFLDGTGTSKEENNDNDDIRLVWAREPNGHPERDLQPDGYARANGTTSGTWPDASGAIHFAVGKDKQDGGGARNSTVYPWYGEDLDPRGGGNWLHFGGTGNRFHDGKGFWNGTVPMGLRYTHTNSGGTGKSSQGTSNNISVTGTMNTSRWTPEGYASAIAHVFHNAFWGNWQFKVEAVQNVTCSNSDCGFQEGQISFSRGGWQEGRGGGIRNQPFFVEGVKEALDVPGEWWLDVPNQVLFYYPFGNETNSTNIASNNNNGLATELRVNFVAPRLKRIVNVVGENSDDRTANGITISGVTFAHTATTFMEPYEVPSPGDWSIHRGGALFVENCHDVTVAGCRFLRTGGNALFLSGHAKRSRLARNEFAWIGDSAVVTVGRISMADGFTVDTFPEDTVIESNHFHEIGIHGKQTSALFSALSCRTTFVSNVAYNGPRAGINLNDQFCHGHTIRDNLLFNWVRETQDHGPINTWDRAMYVQREDRVAANGGEPPKPTLIPEWAHIERNFIMNGPSGNRNLGNLFPTIDNDDGSSYFYIDNNFLVYGGAKNYLGHDKRWISNLLAFPGRWSGDPCAQIWGGKNHLFASNTCIVAPGNPSIGLDGSMKGFECKIDWNDPHNNNLEFVGQTASNVYYMDEAAEWGFGCGNDTSPNHFFTMKEMQTHGWEIGSVVKDRNELNSDAIITLAKKMLAGD